MLKVSRRSVLGVLCKRTNVGSWKHEVGNIGLRQRPNVAVGINIHIHTTTTTVHGAGNPSNNNNRMKSSSNNNNMERMVGLTSIAAVGVLGGMYSYTKTNSAKPSLETNSLIDNQKAEWEAFHLQSLQYNEEDNEDEEEDNYSTNQDDDDQDAAFTKDATIMVNNYVEEESDDDEEDEPTTCSICLINRQGPCRYPWKKFEQCIKQQVPSSSSASKEDKKVCDPFFLPWLECFSQHRLTYSILTNQSIRPEMDFLEETHGTQTPFPTHLVPTLPSQQTYHTMATSLHDDYDDPKNNLNDQEQEKDEEEESLFDVMTSTVYQRKLLNIPLIDPTTGNSIYVAYVRDEPKGNILGFDYFTTELEQLQAQQHHTKEEEDKEEKEEDTSMTQQTLMIPSTTTTGELMFHVPVGTTSVVIHALYKIKMKGEEEPKQDEDRTNKKQHEKAMQPTENETIISDKVYVQTISLVNNNGT
jgi:hypothetical protein